MWTTMKDWFNLRFGLDEYFEERVRSLRVPKNINILYTLGVLTAIAYAVQAFTGMKGRPSILPS